MAKKKEIYIKESKDFTAGWITPQKLKNALKAGKQIKVNDSNKKLLNEFKKETKAAPVSQKQSKSEQYKKVSGNVKGRSPEQTEFEQWKQERARKSEPLKVIKAPKIEINQKAINELRHQVRRNGNDGGKKGTFFPKEYYINLLKEKEKTGLDEIEFLKKVSAENGNVNTYLKKSFHVPNFTTGDFVDKLTSDKQGFKDGSEIKIKDFQGVTHTYKNATEATAKLRELNNAINRTCREIAKQGTQENPKKVYASPNEITTVISTGKTVIEYDFFDLSLVLGDVSSGEFYGLLESNM